MRARSVVGALLIALTGHLWLRQAASSCPTHSRMEAVDDDASHSSANGDAQSAHHQSEAGNGHRHHAGARTSFQCCLALASCGLSLGLAPATSVTTLEPDHLTSLLSVAFLPASRVAAPDPPPPRV
ncbi:MAG TPA: hypothetical protein VGQ52_10155 [Gemmatimonadaceae bacterium]|nr:hypothetical protein [Gemmatimonadaceae bacterium]